eukprot:TRINITY_DN36302_c0_g1_i1.p1 TRINITY_DN36302_c0_g1~~TRINITY_DN36302_c0_g1_i1.p1  ORF type:complete len:129 (+),score=11.22 TRINITY_DN36302_c0_g1_i1:55-441(+)
MFKIIVISVVILATSTPHVGAFCHVNWYATSYGHQHYGYHCHQTSSRNIDPTPAPGLTICECINPWKGDPWNEFRGNPEDTCPRYCYVDCNSDCRGKKNAVRSGRCFSTEICPPPNAHDISIQINTQV